MKVVMLFLYFQKFTSKSQVISRYFFVNSLLYATSRSFIYQRPEKWLSGNSNVGKVLTFAALTEAESMPVVNAEVISTRPGRLEELPSITREMNTLLQDVSVLKGVGPKTAKMLRQLDLCTVLDVLYHFPYKLIDRTSLLERTAEAEKGEVVSLIVKPIKSVRTPQISKISCFGPDGALVELIYYTATRTGRTQISSYMWNTVDEKAKRFVGSDFFVSGKAQFCADSGALQIVHPDIVELASSKDQYMRVEPVYRLTKGLAQSKIQSVVKEALRLLSSVPDFCTSFCGATTEISGWPSFKMAFFSLHNPQHPSDLKSNSPSWQRLVYGEMLATQLTFALKKKVAILEPTKSLPLTGILCNQCLENLPFLLTNNQTVAIAEISKDLASPYRMVRLLQGDVGCGKTVVALFASLQVVESGAQVAFLAPTEILAKQHYETLVQFTKNIQPEVRIGLLGSWLRLREQESIIQSMAEGTVDIIVGTHSLLQGIEFKNLQFTIIDEEQRFGVAQRDVLSRDTNVLLMSATPIPRTLTLTEYGDMEVTKLTEKPGNQRNVQTSSIPIERLDEVIEKLKHATKKGAKAFWIVPLVDVSTSKVQLACAEERFASLKEKIEDVGLLHGKLDTSEKEEVLTRFRQGQISLLVATPIVEVGVDIPDANVCIVENAENFGLSQLHQLRGRIGRNTKHTNSSGSHSFFVMLYRKLSDIAARRLEVICNTVDGFLIAEQDWQMRGPGQVFGRKQWGDSGFYAVDLIHHEDLLLKARDDAQLVAKDVPLFGSEEGNDLRLLLEIYNQSLGCKYLDSAQSTLVSARDSSQDVTKRCSSPQLEDLEKEPVHKQEEKGKRIFAFDRFGWHSKAGVQTFEPKLDLIESIDEVWAPLNVVREMDGIIFEKPAQVSAAGPLLPETISSPVFGEPVNLLSEDVLLVIIDVETTGLNPSSDRITQLAAKIIGFTGHEMLFNIYVDPEIHIPKEVQKLNGITPEFLAEKGAVPFQAAWKLFLAWIKDIRKNRSVVLVAHNAKFDHGMIQGNLKQAEIDSFSLGKAGIVSFVDTLGLLKTKSLWKNPQNSKLPLYPKSFRQTELYSHIFGKKMFDAHNAVGDVLALEEILCSSHIQQF